MSRIQLFRFFFALAAEIALCAALNLFDDWTLEQMPVRFVAVAIGAGIAFLVAVGQFPIRISGRNQALLFWGVAIVLRLVMLPLEPGDELWRYQWEGKIQQAGFNPYQHPPDDPALEPLRTDFPGWYQINHREYHTTYPPGAEIVFATLSRISDKPLLYKLLFALADLATAAVLLRLIPKASRYANAIWYAWNPLVVYSFAGSAHYDSLMLLPMVAAVLYLTKIDTTNGEQKKWLLALTVAVCLGFAISIKVIPLLLLPLCIFALGYRAVTLLFSLLVPVGFGFIYGFPKIPAWGSLRQFAYVTRLNDLSWWVIEETVWPNPRQTNYHYDIIILVAVTLISIAFYRNWRRGMLWVMGLTLLLTPVLHPWYCTWILPLAAWRRVDPWQVLSVTLFAYFLFWNERLFFLPWHAELWLRAIIMIPPLIATVFFLGRERESALTSAGPADQPTK